MKSAIPERITDDVWDLEAGNTQDRLLPARECAGLCQMEFADQVRKSCSSMSDNKKPQPLFAHTEPAHCPICGNVSYSAAGIHPQCAVRQADIKCHSPKSKDKNAKKSAKPKSPIGRWQKTCPKCKASLHVRKKICDCGNEFYFGIQPGARKTNKKN